MEGRIDRKTNSQRYIGSVRARKESAAAAWGRPANKTDREIHLVTNIPAMDPAGRTVSDTRVLREDVQLQV